MPKPRGPRVGDIWDSPDPGAWGLTPGGRPEPGRPRNIFDFPTREEAPRPPREEAKRHWTETPKRGGIFEWKSPEEESEGFDPKIENLVAGWIRENPNYIQDILAGMYGLAGSDERLQEQVRDAREAALDAGEGYPARKDPNKIGRKIETYLPSPKNFEAFKQALLNEFPGLIQKEQKRKAYENADRWIRVADLIYTFGS